jgi:pyruvate/2-oxoglutarate dehydrogenase complex dihydrolipoamide dehydrogenase (E3) component
MTDVTDVDVVVIGLGPGGEATANKLAQAGLSVVAVERHLAGGECPYYGCIPSKMMIRAADVLAESRRIPQLAGDSTTTPSWAPVAERIRVEATADWDDTVAVDRLKDAGADVVRGHGRLTGPGTVEVDGRAYRASRAVVMNTGTAPSAPPIEGLAATPYWTNRDVVKVTEVPASLAVIGAGAIACELAQAFARFGVQVTLLEVADRILAPEEPETSELMTSVLARDGVRVMPGVEIASVAYADGRFTIDLGDETVGVDKLLVAAGRRPQIADLGIDTVGLDPDARSVETDDRMRVLLDGQPVEKLYAVGDITGRGAFTHMSLYEAAVVVRDVLGEPAEEPDFRAVPRVTFTDPEVGSVGITEKQARDEGLAVRIGAAGLPESSRGWLHMAGNDGLIKLVVADGLLVGATSIGPMGGEVLSMLTLAVHAKVPVGTLETMIFAYPTFHGAVRDALTDLAEQSEKPSEKQS